MLKCLKTAITRGPDPLRTQLASFSTVWPRETLSTPRAELGINGLKSQVRDWYRKVRETRSSGNHYPRPPLNAKSQDG